MFSRLSLRAKVVVGYTIVFGLLLCGFAGLTYVHVRQSGLREIDAQLEIYAARVAEDVAQDVEDQEETDPADLKDYAPEGLTETHVQVWNRAGGFYHVDSLLSSWPLRLPVGLDEDESSAETFAHSTGNMRIFWQPVEVDETYPYVVQVSASLRATDAELAELRWLFLLLIPLSLLLSGAAAFALITVAFRPVTHMIDTARKITAQNLDARVEVPAANDEVRKLALTLNDLLARIEAAFASQRQFVADASHELRSPLTVMRTELEYAQKHLQDANTPESLANAIQETARLERLTEQLLTLARMDSATLKLHMLPVRLDDLLLDCVQTIRSAANRKQVRIEVFVEEAMEISGDGLLLSSAVTNLLDNAVKYSPAEQTVDVVLKRHPTQPEASLTVSDHGPGIAEEELELIFRRFYRAKAQRGEANGSGLGLAIARNIVELHHGGLTVKSHLGTGAQFTLTLPLDGKFSSSPQKISA